MKIKETILPGVMVFEPRVFKDDRGYFFETFQQERYLEAGIMNPFIQDNESKSVRGVVRGLHYQLAPYAQAKLVRVIDGEVFDVAVDLRKNSPTFGRWFGTLLSGENKKQMFVPRGFAHGFAVLSDTATFSYKCDNLYMPAYERSIHPFDPFLGVDWGLEQDQALVSGKDNRAPGFREAEMNFE